MVNTFLIFLGAGFGGVFRYWISNISHGLLGKSFPFGTLIVNISGCFIMGILFIFLLERVSTMTIELRALLLIGFLGGYTTFSSFSIETINLFENGNSSWAFINILFSLVLCLAATWLGVLIGRSL